MIRWEAAEPPTSLASPQLPDISTLWDGFWDGDPPTQPFLHIDALVPSPVTPPQRRPSSAPDSRSRNKRNRDDFPSIHARRVWTPVERKHEVTRWTTESLDDLHRGERADRLLELHLRELEREISLLRKNKLERDDIGRLKRMA